MVCLGAVQVTLDFTLDAREWQKISTGLVFSGTTI